VDIVARARMHAALGEPVRIRIVDLLVMGDLSVAEIARSLDISGNLLAHHLDVLQDAGLVERRVSEGDRRRRYVMLTPMAVGVVATTGAIAPAPLFVCTHNSARSQFAAAMWRARTGVLSESAGTEPASTVHPLAISSAARLGIDLSHAIPHGYGDVDLEPEVVISVCDRAAETPNPFRARHLHWSIPDPVAIGDEEAFDAAFDEITLRSDRLLEAER
jgi:protein-tyrosine-phosphatase/DNA-binding HxlR family transcriptional regulator